MTAQLAFAVKSERSWGEVAEGTDRVGGAEER